MSHSTIKKIILPALLVASICLLSFGMWEMYEGSKQETSKDLKEITVTVDIRGASENFVILTKAEYLADALIEASLVKGVDGQYGLFITEVLGVAANEDNQEWWCITKDGEQMFTSVSEEAIQDGNKYEITLFVGW